MTNSSKPVKNYLKGQKKSREVRQKALAERNKTIWGNIMGASLVEGLNTYQQFADDLNNRGYKTSRGNKWTAQSVCDVFKRHQTTAKKLCVDLKSNFVGERGSKLKPNVYKQMVKSAASITDVCEANGKWFSGNDIEPTLNDHVRHQQYGEGHFVKQESLAKYRCKFIKDLSEINLDRLEENIIDIVLPANEIEVFKFSLTNEQRVDKGNRIVNRFHSNKDNFSDPSDLD